ncbi:hypothetical protein ACFL29_02400, partial [Patescibacteria group bacterium]
AYSKTVEDRLEREKAKTRTLKKKINRVRAANSAYVLVLVSVFIGGFLAGEHAISTNWHSTKAFQNEMDQKITKTSQNEFDPYRLADEENFRETLARNHVDGYFVWTAAIKYASLNTDRLIPWDYNYHSARISIQSVEANVIRHLVVGVRYIHPYGSMKVEPKLIFYTFGKSGMKLRMTIDPYQKEIAYEKHDYSSQKWTPITQSTDGYKKSEIKHWRKTLQKISSERNKLVRSCLEEKTQKKL